MLRRTLLAAAALVLVSGAAAATEAPEKKKAGGETYLQLPTLTAGVIRADGRRGVLTVESGLDAPDAALRGRAEVSIPRLWDDSMGALLGPPRKRTEPLSDRDRDVAASLQLRFEEVYLEMVGHAVEQTGVRDVVMAGGSVLNSVGNGRMITERVVDRAYFHPAASDDGTAAGAALHVMHGIHDVPRWGEVPHAYWGTAWTDDQIEKAVVASGLPFRKLDRPALLETAAGSLATGKIVGWFQGREEWGPRALGNRSILCHPGWPDMKATLNARIKNREPFRPFAPAVCPPIKVRDFSFTGLMDAV